MKQIIKDLKDVKKALTKLGQKTNKIKKQLEMHQKAQSVTKTRKKAAAKARPVKKASTKIKRESASKVLLEIIKKSRSKKGVDTAALKKKSGFDERKIWNVINSLKSQKLIKSGGRGYYVQA